jgi:DNA-binding transcriptional MocR family regulator
MSSDQAMWEPKYATRAARMQASEIRELLKLLDEPDIISFAGGIPDPALFPVDLIRTAYSDALGKNVGAHKLLQYSISEGDPALRRWIAGYMAARGVPCEADNILITNGSQQGLEFLGRMLLNPNDTALVMAPTYLGALQAFAASEPVYDELSLDPTNRTAASYADAARAGGGDVKFAYVVPDFSNPTGETVSLAGRRHILSLAADLDIPVIEDNPYTTLRYEGEAQPFVQALDVAVCGGIDQSRVIHLGSFSKVFTPGLRVGWVCAAKPIIRRLTLVKQASDLNASALNQAVMCRLAEQEFDAQVARACKSYRVKRDAMLEALAEHMPKGSIWSTPEGGLFVWVTLPDGFDTAALLPKVVADARVAYVPGHAFFADGSGCNTMRLSFSLPTPDVIRDGIERLGAVLKSADI